MLGIFFLISCSKKDNTANPSDIWDIETNGIPKFVNHDFIELEKVKRVSKYRSSEGHDYSDAFEHCRSMKHYFEPSCFVDWAAVQIFSPVDGQIKKMEQEWAGIKIEIESSKYPAFRFIIFHVNINSGIITGDSVRSGQLLGLHVGSQTMSDIAVMVNDPTRQGRLVSFFETLADSVFDHYVARSVTAREMLIIPKELRDANPLFCDGENFVGNNTIDNWVVLN